MGDLESDIHSDLEINSDPNLETDSETDFETEYETDFLMDTDIDPFNPSEPDYQYYGFTFRPESSTSESGYTFPPGSTDQPFTDGFTFPPDFTFDPSTNYPWTTPYPYPWTTPLPFDFTTDNNFSAILGKDFLPVKSVTNGATGLLEYPS